MPKSFVIKASDTPLLLPFGYAFISRYHWPRDFVVNALTAWVPGIILVASVGDIPALSAPMVYLLGYIAFICVYEVGYLANDTIGLRHDPTPRRRIDLVPGPAFIAVFLIIRVFAFLLAAWALDCLSNPLFWGGFAVLAVTLIAHNTLHATELKFYSFLQLSLLRFALPVWPVLQGGNDTGAPLMVLLTGLLLFSLPRFLTYLDAKGRLHLPERKRHSYHLKAHLTVLPMVVLLSVISKDPAPLLCAIWLGLVQIIYVARANVTRRTTNKTARA